MLVPICNACTQNADRVVKKIDIPRENLRLYVKMSYK